MSSQNQALQREGMQWEMAKVLLGLESDSSVEERSQPGTLLRKRLMESLRSPSHAVEALPNAKRHRLDSASGTSDATLALLEISGGAPVDSGKEATCVTETHRNPSISMSVSGLSYLGQTPSSYQRTVDKNN